MSAATAATTTVTAAAATTSRSRLAVGSGAAGAFAAVLLGLALQMRDGSDPLLHLGPVHRRVVVRRIVEQVTEIRVVPADVPTASGTSVQSSATASTAASPTTRSS